MNQVMGFADRRPFNVHLEPTATSRRQELHQTLARRDCAPSFIAFARSAIQRVREIVHHILCNFKIRVTISRFLVRPTPLEDDMKLSPVPPGPKGHFLVGSLPEIQRDELDFLMEQVHEHGDVVHLRKLSIIPCTSSATLVTLKPCWSAKQQLHQIGFPA
jgi:hypothetical protein